MSLGLYYTNLPAGTQYNYFAFSYPTLYFGTFSFGILRIATGGIDIYGAQVPIKISTADYGRTLFLLGYGIRVIPWLSVGTALKVERVVFPGYPNELSGNYGSISESAFGADLGLLFIPGSDVPLLRDIQIGLNVQNIIQRSLRAVDQRELTPINMRLGYPI
jgi:hypothetical protein